MTQANVEPSTGRPTPLRFSLRSLLLATTALSIILATIGPLTLVAEALLPKPGKVWWAFLGLAAYAYLREQWSPTSRETPSYRRRLHPASEPEPDAPPR